MLRNQNYVINIINIFGIFGIYIFCCIIGQPLVIWIYNTVNEFSLISFDKTSFDRYYMGEEFIKYLLLYSPLLGMGEICGLIVLLVIIKKGVDIIYNIKCNSNNDKILTASLISSSV